MRSKLFPILVVILLVVLAGGAFACKAPVVVAPPTGVKINGDVLMWNEVENAIEYHVTVDGGEVITVYEPQYLIELYDSVPHTLTVSVVTADGESAKSASVSYTRASESAPALKVLAAPSMRISATRLMWNNVLGNSGYRIIFNNQTIDVAKNVTYYDLLFPADGEYIIRMQTVGDGITYYSSQRSELKVTITKGKAKLLALASEPIRYDPVKKRIEWSNKYSAESVRYQIYKDDVMVEEINADATLATMSYAPVLVGSCTYTMRLASNDGLYDTSAFSEGISFPIAEPAVMGLRLDAEDGYYYFRWDKCTYASSYILTVDGNTYSASQERIALPSGLAVGEHIAKVRGVGDGLYLAGSVSSAEMAFTLGVGGIPTERLGTPVIRQSILNDEHCVIGLVPEENASGYSVRIVKGEERLEFKVTEPSFTFLRSSEDPSVIALFTLLDAGARLSVSAYSDSSRYLDSPYCGEVILAEDKDVLTSPSALTMYPGGVKWDEMADVEEYVLSVDGETIRTTWTRYEPSFTSGEHTFKVSAVAENALFSEELIVRLPFRLDAPSALQVTSGMLSYLPSENAASYELYANGESIGQISVAMSVIDLSKYIETDGRYVLTMRAVAPSKYYADSYLSEEIVYVKTDGKSGTLMKPYRIRTAEEFITMIAADPSAYFTLTEAEYDFKDVDTSALSRVKFSGHIDGNNAVLKNIVTSTGLFDIIEGSRIDEEGHVPELADLTFEIRPYAFTFDGKGAFARTIRSALLKKVTVSLSGTVTLTKENAFGLAVYEVSDARLDGCTLISDGLTVSSSQKITVAAFAYKLGGEVISFATQGALTLNIREVIYGGISREGECTISDPALALGVDVTATTAALYGVTIAGDATLSGGSISAAHSVRNADIITYYGVVKENATVQSAALGGSLTVTNSKQAEIYGVTGGQSGLLADTMCALTLNAATTERLIVGGIADSIEAGLSLENVTFGGSFTLNAPNVQGAALAVQANVPVAFSNAGSIAASGEEILLSGGVIDGAGADVTFAEGASLSVTNATNVVLVGAALDSSATVAVRGTLALSLSDCEEVSVSGVFGGLDGEVNVDGYTVTGDLKANKLSFGGVADATQVIRGRISALAVDLTVLSDDMRIGGAIAYAEAISLTERATVSANIVANGMGQVAGFATEMMNASVENLLVTGSMSLAGEGELYGAVGRAFALTNVESRADLTAQGNVRVSGIAGEIGEGNRLTLSKSNITLVADQARLYGIAATASTVSANISEVTFSATPVTYGGGSLELCGMAGALDGASGILIEKTTFEIGRFYNASFAAVAKTAGGSLRSGSFGYTLTCIAVNSEIGGVFGTASGLMDGYTVGSSTAPVSITVSGNASIGGIAVNTTENLTMNKVTTDIRLSLDLAESGTAKAGGAFATASGTVKMTDTNISVMLEERKGGGTVYIGGAVAELSGDLTGARTNVSFTSTVATDVFGGIAAKMRGGSLKCASAEGTISAANAGGLIGNSSVGEGETHQRPVIKECATRLTMSGGAGLIYVADKTDIEDSYSIATTAAGLIYSGTDVKLTNCYFGGIAEYSVAYRAVGAVAVGLVVEASLRAVLVQNTGDALAPVYMTLAYASNVKALADVFDREIWTLSETSYPYLTAIGFIGVQPEIAAKNLSEVEITDGMDLYNAASYRNIACELPAVVWVDQSRKLLINDGIITLTDDREGELRGYLSGGKLVYILPYVINDFEPFTGRGTVEDPYIVTDLVNFKHIPRFANDYYAAHGELAHFEFKAGEYEDVVIPSITTSYAAVIDCNGVVLRSPTLSAGGIFGNLTGGSISDLTVIDPECADVVLFASATDVTISSVNVRVTVGNGVYALAGSMTDSALEASSFTVEEEGSDFSVYILNEAHGATFTLVQLFVSAPSALPASSVSFVRSDVGSSFDRCAVYIAAELRESYPFAETGVNTSVSNSAAVIYRLTGEKSACSDMSEMQLSDLTVRFCDCDLFSYDEDVTDASAHKDSANISESVANAADELAESYHTFLAHYSPTDESAQWKITSPSAPYDDYSVFYAKICAFFGIADTGVVGGATHTLTSGAVIGSDKPYSILFGSETTATLRTVAARTFGYESADTFAEKAAAVAALLTENAEGASTDSLVRRLVYDGAIRTENDYYVLPYAFMKGDLVTLVCVFIAPDGSMSLWISDIDSAKQTANADGGSSMMQTHVTTEAYGRCSLFDRATLAPVKWATGVKYTGVAIAVNGDPVAVSGVTYYGYDEIAGVLASAPYSFEGTDVLTPIGYTAFGRGEEDFSFTLKDEEADVTSLTLDGVLEWDIYENWYIESDASFGEAVGFSMPAALGVVTADGVIRVRGNGTGTLTVTNFYGESKEVTLTIVNYYGFDHGTGKESDPYELHTVADLYKMEHFENAYFILKENIAGTLTAPLALNGRIDGDGKTLRLTLDGTDHVFSEASGRIENMRIEIVATETAQALFMSQSGALTLTDVTFVLSDVTMTVSEGETVGLLFDRIESNGDDWSGITLDLANVTVNAPQGGTIGLLAGQVDQKTISDLDITATVVLSAGGDVTFGGLVGSYLSYDDEVLLSHVTADMTITANLGNISDCLTLGGVIGDSSAAISDVNATVDITVNASDKQRGEVYVGGVVGANGGKISDVKKADGNVTVYAKSGAVGGVVGRSSAELTDIKVDSTVYAECAVRAITGGVAGELSALLYQGRATGSVTAVSHATDEDLPALENEEHLLVVVAAAGGAAGYMEGTLRCYTVSSVTVTATASSISEGYVLAGGAAGYLSDALDIAVDGAVVTATGVESVAGGAAAALKKNMDYAVLSDLTLSGAKKGGAAGVFSFVDDASISRVFCTADVGESGAAIVDHIVVASVTEPTGTVSYCTYLYGKAIGDDVAAGYDVENVKASVFTEFYGTSLYDTENVTFDTDIWAFREDGLPTIKA